MKDIRKTPWSKITDIKLIDDGFIEYIEKVDLKYPSCPIILLDPIDLPEITFKRRSTKIYFELMYGSIEDERN